MTPAAPAHAPLFGVSQPDQLRFSRQERRLLKIVQRHNEREFNQIALQKNSRELALELCFERHNCIHWLPIGTTETVLEIGAGVGALTGGWANQAAQVVAVELAPQRACINAIRHRNRDNVEIHAGPFPDTVSRLAARQFNIIALIGTLPMAEQYVGPGENPAQRLLASLRNLLTDDGRVIIALPNRFGLKYWAGSAENTADRPFTHLKGLPDSAGGRPFSKTDLEQVARASGFASATFFYPYPDYRFTSVIYSHDRLPTRSELCFNQLPWDAQTMALFHPGKVFDELIRHNMFPMFSNSYLIVLQKNIPSAPAPEDHRIIYSKLSTKRRRPYQIRTDILMDGRGDRVIRKRAYSPATQAHVENLIRYHDALAQLYAGTKLVPNRGHLRQGAAELEYILGPSLADQALEQLQQGQCAAFMELMADFFHTVRSLATEDFHPTDPFHQVFGKPRLPAGLKSAPISNIDLILPNIIVHDNRWHVIDYEWTFAFPVPVDFILFRTLHYLFAHNRETDALLETRDDLYRMADIVGNLRSYLKMELALQNYIVAPGTFVQDLAPGNLLVPRKSRFALETLLIRWLPRSVSEQLAHFKQLWTGRA